MGSSKKSTETRRKSQSRPAASPEARESQLVSLAYDLAEQQLRDGTATSQTINHFLKLGSTRAELEREKLQNENLLLMAKANAIESSERADEFYAEAMKAYAKYSGHSEEDES